MSDCAEISSAERYISRIPDCCSLIGDVEAEKTHLETLLMTLAVRRKRRELWRREKHTQSKNGPVINAVHENVEDSLERK